MPDVELELGIRLSLFLIGKAVRFRSFVFCTRMYQHILLFYLCLQINFSYVATASSQASAAPFNPMR